MNLLEMYHAFKDQFPGARDDYRNEVALEACFTLADNWTAESVGPEAIDGDLGLVVEVFGMFGRFLKDQAAVERIRTNPNLCPFCGSNKLSAHWDDEAEHRKQIMCLSCIARWHLDFTLSNITLTGRGLE